MYYTYVLDCQDNNLSHELYIGSCKDLRTRLIKHQNKSVKTTKKFITIKLIYYEACLNKTDAIKRENQLKTGFGRGYIKRRLLSYYNLRD